MIARRPDRLVCVIEDIARKGGLRVPSSRPQSENPRTCIYRIE